MVDVVGGDSRGARFERADPIDSRFERVDLRLDEGGQHRLYAERDLKGLEAGGA
jgi:hypothetical protein